ncbi:MAG: hypothetical protein EON58_09285 [Alphaproteobacteria bacterium]|nr:MAG: hypothetical protein EON58_09285 [Alphaproteobacteria bacterium]
MTEPHASSLRDVRDHRRFDGDFPSGERFPARVRLSFDEREGLVSLRIDGEPIGDLLSDARRASDGYRFHDALHMTLASKLGWSPVVRAMLGRKRRSDPETDRCEDGGRARMVEEAICHAIHVYRDELKTPDGMSRLVAHIQRMASGFEVEAISPAEWADAIAAGLEAMRALELAGGGDLEADFVKGDLHLV